MFLDEVRIVVRAGAGGDGAATMRREAHVPRGGPDGGDGGRGGSVYLRVDAGQTTLRDFRYKSHFSATPGGSGERQKRHGKAGEDLYLVVPPGTAVIDEASGGLIADLVAVGQEAMVSRGGRGGLGNVHFATATHQAPKHAQRGEPGEEKTLRLELRLIADVGLVGLPNAGKSTLLAALTSATPKIAPYPFTTLEPNLGVVRVDEGRTDFEMVVADIPGLIEGASEGKGLGHQFLRHIERARALVVLLDLAGGAGVPPDEQLRVLLHELGEYRPELLDRPRIVVGSRADVAVEHLDGIATVQGFGDHRDGGDDGHGEEGDARFDLEVSAITGAGLPVLVGRMADAVRAARQEQPAPDAFIVHRPVAQGFRIEREDDGAYRVVGREAERAVAFSDLTNLDALDEAHVRLRRLGIDKALARAGASEGDIVRIGTLTFAYEN